MWMDGAASAFGAAPLYAIAGHSFIDLSQWRDKRSKAVTRTKQCTSTDKERNTNGLSPCHTHDDRTGIRSCNHLLGKVTKYGIVRTVYTYGKRKIALGFPRLFASIGSRACETSVGGAPQSRTLSARTAARNAQGARN
jgi:hypothetical protein